MLGSLCPLTMKMILSANYYMVRLIVRHMVRHIGQCIDYLVTYNVSVYIIPAIFCYFTASGSGSLVLKHWTSVPSMNQKDKLKLLFQWFVFIFLLMDFFETKGLVWYFLILYCPSLLWAMHYFHIIKILHCTVTFICYIIVKCIL